MLIPYIKLDHNNIIMLYMYLINYGNLYSSAMSAHTLDFYQHVL
jgi:hypothetical protein